MLHVVVAFRPGYPELSTRNPMFAALAKSGRFVLDTPGTEVAPEVAPQDGEPVVVRAAPIALPRPRLGG